MNVARHLTSIKSIALTATLLVASLVLVAGLWAPAANAASGITNVTSNIASVPSGNNLVLTISAQNDGDVQELEVDHSLEAQLPEFSVYASESNPYGDSKADFDALGVTVTYNSTDSAWTIDLGEYVTNVIQSDMGDEIKFYFTLRSADQVLWGDMYNASAWPTFDFNLAEGTSEVVEGTEYSLVEPTEDDEETEEEAVIPGVPNTSVVW